MQIYNSYTGFEVNLIFTETELKGAFIIEVEKINDERGFFARTWDKEKFEKHNLNSNIVQCSISINKKKGTIRGMHYQVKPYEESKIVRCTKGKIFDVIIDLRKKSSTFKKWISVEISENNHKMIYIPKGFAHGFQTLEDNTEIFYQISEFYNKDASSGIKCNDPELSIKWPLEITMVSEKDKNFPYLENVIL